MVEKWEVLYMGSHTDYMERCSSIAVFGGTFDPIHNGHLAIAEAVLHQFKPQRVLFVPAGNPPHKPDKPITPAEHRYQMILRSICQTPGFDVTRLEIDRTGASYTIDTIHALRGLCPPGCVISFIIGQDALLNILTWKDAPNLLKLCQFITVPRPGYNPDKLNAQVAALQDEYGAVIHILQNPLMEISSTQVRAAFAAGEPVGTIVSKEAAGYIRTHGLYQTPIPDLGQAHFEWAKSQLQSRLTPKRFKHTLGVVIEAERLAKHYGADIKKARWAALLHDCTKEYGVDKKHMLCDVWGVPTDPVIDSHIDLAHGLLGAESARRHFYVTDEEILQAIRFHILGHGNMTLLDKIIVLADFIEPYREDYHPLQEMRAHAYTDINKALVVGLQAVRDMDAARGKILHNWSRNAIRFLKEGYDDRK